LEPALLAIVLKCEICVMFTVLPACWHVAMIVIGYGELRWTVWLWRRRHPAFLVDIKLLIRVCDECAQLYRMLPVRETTSFNK